MALRWKLLLWIGMPVMLIYLLVLWLEYRHLRAATLDHVTARCTASLARTAAEVDGDLRLTEVLAAAQADALTLGIADEATLRAAAERLLASLPLVGDIELTSEGPQPSRVRFARDGNGVRAVALERAPVFTAGWTTMPRADAPAQPLLSVRAQQGTTVVTIRAVLMSRAIGAAISQPIFADSRAVLVDRDGRYLWHTDPALLSSGTSVLEHAVQTGRPELVALLKPVIEATSGRERGFIRLPSNFAAAQPTLLVHAPLTTADWQLITLVSESDILAPVHAHVRRTAGIMLAGLALVLAAVWLTSRRLTQPLSELARQSKLLIPSDGTQPSPPTTSRDASRLTLSLDMISNNVREAKMRIASETARRESAEGELRVARRMQESLLPQPLAADTLRPFGISLHAVNLPAAEVAGDFFDHFIDARGRLVICIADVSGKGASAAMLMAVTRTALRGAADGAEGPADIVRSINRFLLENTHDTVSFVTMIVLLIHRDGTMVYSNAGHPPAVCVCAQRVPLDIAPGTGTVVGIVPDDEAPAGQAELSLPADWTRLVFVTDGVLEAAQPAQTITRHTLPQQREMFGLARLHTVLASCSHTPASEICDAIVRAVQTFEGANRGDDVTVMVIARDANS